MIRILFVLLIGSASGIRLQLRSETQHENNAAAEPYALVLAADPKFGGGRALAASIRSVIRSTNATFNVHVFALDEDKDKFEKKWSDIDGVPIRMHYFSRSEIDPYINKAMDGPMSPGLDSPYNFARLLMAEKIPEADGMIWMDSDVITTIDIFADMPQFLQSGKILGSSPRDGVTSIEPGAMEEINKISDLPIQGDPYFNAGFYYFSGAMYRASDSDKHMQELIASNNEHKWWIHSGTQTPLNLLLGGENFYAFHVPYIYNLGTDRGGKESKLYSPSDKFVFHWNGPWKPWKKEGPQKMLWEAFDEPF